ncbi:hypothetical protein [Helicobacter pullorum]|uniref:hypothetical protein n=1 Tax=Helicobacter pullorum TaxID=35818 RepID=UPI002432C0A3|nr:hypothetical protein [Helicobacter pullorum]
MLLLGGTNYIVDVGGGGIREYANKLEFSLGLNETFTHNLKGKTIFVKFNYRVLNSNGRGHSCYFDGMKYGRIDGNGTSGVFTKEYIAPQNYFSHSYVEDDNFGWHIKLVEIQGEVYYN